MNDHTPPLAITALAAFCALLLYLTTHILWIITTLITTTVSHQWN